MATLNWNPDEDVWEPYNLEEEFSQANDLAGAMPEKLQAMKDTFTMQATENKEFPIGGAFYPNVLHSDEVLSLTLTEWTLFPGQVRKFATQASRQKHWVAGLVPMKSAG